MRFFEIRVADFASTHARIMNLDQPLPKIELTKDCFASYTIDYLLLPVIDLLMSIPHIGMALYHMGNMLFYFAKSIYDSSFEYNVDEDDLKTSTIDLTFTKDHMTQCFSAILAAFTNSVLSLFALITKPISTITTNYDKQVIERNYTI